MGENKEVEKKATEVKVQDTKVAPATQDKKVAKKKTAEKKPNIFKRMGRKCKEVFSELKKVSWPTFGKVVKNTGIVLVVVAIFMVVITAFDFGLLQGLKALSKIEPTDSSSIALLLKAIFRV